MNVQTLATRYRFGTAVMVLAAALLAGACTGDDDDNGPAAEDEVRRQLEEGLAAERSGDAEGYLAHVTGNWLATVIQAIPAATIAGTAIRLKNGSPTLTFTPRIASAMSG